MANQPKPKKAPEKLHLLLIDQLTMGEVMALEKFSGMATREIMATAEDGIPFRALMGLAWLTEKRANPMAPGARKSFWINLPYTEFNAVLEARFEFELLEDTDDDGEDGDDGEDPTNAA